MAVPLWNQYGGCAAYVSSGTSYDDQTVSGALQQLARIQAIQWDIPYPLQDQVYTDGGIDSYMVTPPGADVVIDYYVQQGTNDRFLGLGRFTASGTLEVGFEAERNLYIAYQNNQGQDAVGAPVGVQRLVLGLSQGVMTSYQLSASIGTTINARAGLNYLTAFMYSGASGERTPTIDPRNGNQLTGRFVVPAASSLYNPDGTGYALDNTAALGFQELIMMFPQQTPFGITYTGMEACFLQSMQLGLDINRQALKPMGYAYPQDRPVVWPIRVDLTTEAIVGTYQPDVLRRLTCTTTGQAVFIAVKQPCSATTTFGFYFTDLQLVNQSVSSNIGDKDRVTTQWRGWLKSPSDTFISPFFNTIIDVQSSGVWGTTW